MSPKPVLTAIALTLALGAGVVQAQEGPRPATAQERAAFDRLDPLGRSVAWARERDINPNDPIAGVRVAEALRQLGQFDQAVQAADTVLVSQPDNLEALLELGRAHIARGQAFYGIAPLEKAHGLAARDWRPLSLLGVAYTAVRRGDEGRDAWNRGLTLSPDNPDILTNAAMALVAEGDAAGAEVLLRRAAAQPHAALKVRQNLALVLGLQGKTGEAEQILRRDLPPEAADANLRWLADRLGGGVQRDWSALR